MRKPLLSLLLCCSLFSVLLSGCGKRSAQDYPRGWKTEDVDYAMFRPPIAEVRNEFVLKAEQLLKAGDYAAIEQEAAQRRYLNEELLDGTNKVSALYDGLAMGAEVKTDADWRARNRLLLEWRKKHPRSITAQIALANNYFRGRDIAFTMGSEQAKQEQLAQQRLTSADKVLQEAGPSARDCPGWYLVRQSTLMTFPSPHPSFVKLTGEALARYPEVKELHFNRAYHLAHPSNKNPGQWQAYTARIADQMKGQAGDRFYAQAVWYILRTRNETVHSRLKTFDWPRAKRGFELLMNQNPQNPTSVAGPYAVAAWLARDRATLKNLFEKHIGKRIDASVWPTISQFLAARRWAVGKEED